MRRLPLPPLPLLLLTLLPLSAPAQDLPEVRFVAHERSAFTTQESVKLDGVLNSLERVVNSETFRQQIREFRTCVKVIPANGDEPASCVYRDGFHFERGETSFTSEQVLARIVQGEEIYNDAGGAELQPAIGDLFLAMYYKRNQVVGYTYPRARVVHLNRRFFGPRSTEFLAGSLVHEWMHKLGFTHAFERSRLRDYSVPYAIGAMVRTLAGR